MWSKIRRGFPSSLQIAIISLGILSIEMDLSCVLQCGFQFQVRVKDKGSKHYRMNKVGLKVRKFLASTSGDPGYFVHAVMP
jgi:hypothetical protein